MMRQAINENRTVQLALLGVLALVGAFMLLKGGGGNSSSEPTASSSTAAGATPADTGTATPASTTATTTGGSAGSVAAAVGVPVNMVPGRGLPKGLLPAYRHGKAVVLLVRRAGGIDDALVRDAADLLRSAQQAKLYVTKARRIARYSWLTQGVNVSQLPALVVLRPRKLSHGTPTASVSYGFRKVESVIQAVKDGLYRGPAHRPYHP